MLQLITFLHFSCSFSSGFVSRLESTFLELSYGAAPQPFTGKSFSFIFSHNRVSIHSFHSLPEELKINIANVILFLVRYKSNQLKKLMFLYLTRILYMKAQGWVKYRIGETRLLILMFICGLFLNLSVALILVSNYFLHPFENTFFKENRS